MKIKSILTNKELETLAQFYQKKYKLQKAEARGIIYRSKGKELLHEKQSLTKEEL